MANITSTDKLITLTGLDAFKAKMLQKITDSQYNDTAVRGLINTNKSNISTLTTKVNTLNANSTTSGSVDYKIAQARTAITNEINSAVSSAYKVKGSIDFSALANVESPQNGDVYNINDSFTTTDSFVEGEGKKYPAGTNVVYVVPTTGNPGWDVLAGFVDLSDYTTTFRAQIIAEAKAEAALESAKSYADTQDAATLSSAKSYADTKATSTLNSAKSYADTKSTSTLNSAKTYADTQDATTLSSAKTYSDNAVAKCVKYTDVTLATTTEIEALFA